MMQTEVSENRPASASALAELYVRHAPGAIGLAYLLTGDRYMAEDLAQEAFVRVAGKFRYLRVPDAFEAYLRRTIVNLFTSELRRRRLERTYLQREQRGARDVRVETVDVTIRDELWNALGRLPSRQRAAVVLRYYEDLSERDVAEIMRCSVPAMKSLVSRGMDTLRTMVRGEDA
jgi:RNA polymerase sigma-70 factor (sigma-E family)